MDDLDTVVRVEMICTRRSIFRALQALEGTVVRVEDSAGNLTEGTLRMVEDMVQLNRRYVCPVSEVRLVRQLLPEEEERRSECCGAYLTYIEETLCCRACLGEVTLSGKVR
jgi:hypothetical protein